MKLDQAYALDGGRNCGHDEHGGENDHNSIGEVVDVEVVGEVPHAHEDEGLQERVGDVKLHVPPEHELDYGPADVVHRLELQRLRMKNVHS